MIVIDLDEPTRVHLWRAIRSYARQLRRDGMQVPGELAQLAATLVPCPDVSRSGQERPAVDVPEPVRQADDAASTAAAAVGIGEVSRRLGVSDHTVRRLSQSGELRSMKIRGRRLWRVADVDAYLEARDD